VALLLDQNTKPEEGGLFVSFFGLSIPMSTAAAVLSERTGAPMIPIFCRVNANGTYTIYSLPPLKRADMVQAGSNIIQTITQTIASLFEQEIRTYPEQWLWMYKRWKYIDPDWPVAAYPFLLQASAARLSKQPAEGIKLAGNKKLTVKREDFLKAEVWSIKFNAKKLFIRLGNPTPPRLNST